MTRQVELCERGSRTAWQKGLEDNGYSMKGSSNRRCEGCQAKREEKNPLLWLSHCNQWVRRSSCGSCQKSQIGNPAGRYTSISWCGAVYRRHINITLRTICSDLTLYHLPLQLQYSQVCIYIRGLWDAKWTQHVEKIFTIRLFVNCHWCQ